MKHTKLTRILLVLLSLILLTGSVTAVFAAVMRGDADGDGKITAFDAQMIAEQKAGFRVLSEEQLGRIDSLSAQDILNIILNKEPEATEPAEPSEPSEPSAPAVDPNAIASVTNGAQTEYVTAISEMTAAVAADGNTQITLLKDITASDAITFPYSCTIDLNGHTISTLPSTGNCLQITAAGTQNKTTTVKNGTMLYYQVGLRVAQGAFIIDNMTMHGTVGTAIAIRDTADYASINRISNSTLTSGGWGCVAFHVSTSDFSNTGYSIDNSTLISYVQPASNTLTKSGSAVPGSVTLGENVNLYTYAASFTASGYVVKGMPAAQVASDATVTINDVSYTGLNHWCSGKIGSEEPTEDAIAQVVNGTQTLYVSNVADLCASVQSSGNTQIKLLKDITTTAPITFAYSCSIDFDGHTVTTNPTTGNGIQIMATGTENKTTTIKNGTLIHADLGLRVTQGAFIVDNMTMHSANGACVGIYDTTDYRSINRITNSTLTSGNWGCVTFNVNGADFSKTGFTVDHSTIISYKAAGSFVFVFSGSADPGQIKLGEEVDLYSYQNNVSSVLSRYDENSKHALRAEETASVTVKGVTYTDLNHWSTGTAYTPIRMLLIGNSFCYRLVEELYGVARAAGYELYIANLYEAGCYVEEHWTWLNDNSPNYELYVTNSMGRIRMHDIKTLSGALAHQEWDIITLQQHFPPQYSIDRETALNSCVPYVNNLYNYLKENHPDADLYWHETWAYQVGHSLMPSAELQTTQYENIKYVSELMCEENNVPMIPGGDAWQLARASVGDTLCLEDQYHDGDVGGGQYLNACVWLEVLTGTSCIGNTWRPVDYALDEALIAKLQVAAHQAVADLYGADYAK